MESFTLVTAALTGASAGASEDDGPSASGVGAGGEETVGASAESVGVAAE
ncbi:hypothetical protein AALP_AA3G008400 [Arabis alpina]|uniref:Uncharacterized protein n=1 Tax=Arabis alpina TaxID=50452 RepID=A0A087H680_ARAAL|nr:hypothetical protein AALP_AA3G008400 [Arabis alpina]